MCSNTSTALSPARSREQARSSSLKACEVASAARVRRGKGRKGRHSALGWGEWQAARWVVPCSVWPGSGCGAHPGCALEAKLLQTKEHHHRILPSAAHGRAHCPSWSAMPDAQ